MKTRSEYLDKFDKGIYKVIVAINVLDEGVDIPSTKMAIILASSGNPKQYIQRRGRILRKFPGKKNARIYDILVLPPIPDILDDFNSVEKKIIGKELKRHEEIASISLNYSESLKEIENIKRRYRLYP